MTFNPETWAAILGAVVGGVIAFLIQLIALYAAKRERDASRKEARLANGSTLFFKVIRMVSNINNLHKYMEEAFTSPLANENEEPFAFVLPLANYPVHVNFNEPELILAYSLKDDNLFHSIIQMDQVHNSLVDQFATLGSLSKTLRSSLPAQIEDGVGTTTLTHEQMLLLRPKMVEINSLIYQLRERAKADSIESRNTLVRLHGSLKKNIGLRGDIKFLDE